MSVCHGEGRDAGADDLFWSFFSLSLYDYDMKYMRNTRERGSHL